MKFVSIILGLICGSMIFHALVVSFPMKSTNFLAVVLTILIMYLYTMGSRNFSALFRS